MIKKIKRAPLVQALYEVLLAGDGNSTIADVFGDAFFSNTDRISSGKQANIADGLFAISKSIDNLADVLMKGKRR